MAKHRLNVQGLARRDPALMSCLLADEGMTVVSADLTSGEPSVLGHFSKDPMYLYATVQGKGKAPAYNPNGVLLLDDIYLMTASVSPLGKDLMWDAFNTTYNGLRFDEQWLTDPEVIKDALSEIRKLHKMLCLALGYSMGPKKMVKQAYEQGYTITMTTAREFFNTYWNLFNKIKRLGDVLGSRFKHQGYLVNPFGFRLTPDKDYKALNYFIQSSVSSIMHILLAKFFTACPYAIFITVIHDEVLFEVPTSKLREAKAAMDIAVTSLNTDLKWDVPIRVGWAPGKNWYEAK